MAGKATYAVGLLALPIAFPILFIVMIGGQALSSPAAACGEEGVSVGPSSDPDLDAEQMRVAQQIVAAVRAFPATADKPHAAVIALATARQESGIRNLDYGDRDSLGAFQQRPSQGWGTPEQVMNVPHATTTFLQHLILIPGWETRRVTDVAADVQRPAEEYRGLYEQWVPLATRLTEQLWPGATASLTTAPAACGVIAVRRPGRRCLPGPAGVHRDRQPQLGRHRQPLEQLAHGHRLLRAVRHAGPRRDERDRRDRHEPGMGRHVAGQGRHRAGLGRHLVRPHAGARRPRRAVGRRGSATRARPARAGTPPAVTSTSRCISTTAASTDRTTSNPSQWLAATASKVR